MKLIEAGRYVPVPQRVIAVLWISFLMAGAATMVFFAAIDPMQLKNCVDFPEVGRTAAYSIGFLLFWLLTAASSLFTTLLLYPGAPANAPDNSSRPSR